MNNDIKSHKKFVNNRLDQIKSECIDKTNFKIKLKQLAGYNQTMIQNFQHERHIHLLVTLFFGLMTIISAGLVFVIATTFQSDAGLYIINVLVSLVFAIFLVVEIFYIFHYFKLENGTQDLYSLSKKIYELIEQAED